MDDPRIRHVRELVRSRRYDVLSLDLFDTVLWRMVPVPRDVFFLVARRLLERGWMRDSSTPESFARERTDAEERARRAQPSREVTLGEIYDAFPRGYLCEATPADAAAMEFQVEREVVRADPHLLDLIQEARDHGLRVAFVSDTYLDAAQITALVGVEADHLLLSGAERLSKSLGLHGRLVERSGVAPSRILHVGNDYHADIEGPSVFGLDRYWYPIWPEPYETMLSQELPGTLSRRAAFITGPDHGLTALRSRAMALAVDPHERWGAGVLGPVVAGFADWVAGRCRTEGMPVALCLMREGRILRRVLEVLETGLSARELFVSRYAARKAAILDGTEAEIRDFVLRPSPQPRARILEQLGLPPAEDGAGDALLTPRETKDLIRRIAGNRALRARVVADSARVRAGLVAHLRAVLGDRIPERVAVVDLGYRGTIQECLERIAAREGLGFRTHGLYLVTGGQVHETQATGAVAEGWLAENGQPIAMAHTFMRSPEIVEQSLMATVGTTIDYGPEGEPVLDQARVPGTQDREIAAVQQGLLTYAAAWRRHKERWGIGDTASLHALHQAILIRSVARPLPVEMDLFESWVHDENFGSGAARGLAAAGLTDWELAHASAHQLASLPMSVLHWPFGLAHRLSPTLGEAVAHIYLRDVDPAVFDAPHPPQALVAYWDTGRGFRAEEAAIQSYRLNHRGRVWQRFTMRLEDGAPPRRLGFSVGLKEQVLHLAGAAVRVDEGEAVRRLPHDALELHGYRHLHGTLYTVTEDPPLIVVPVEDLPPGAARLDVDLFFGLVLGG